VYTNNDISPKEYLQQHQFVLSYKVLNTCIFQEVETQVACTMYEHTVPGCPYVDFEKQGAPDGMGVSPEGDHSFDPNHHIQLEIPAYLKHTDGTQVPYPVPLEHKGGFDLAYSAPFRVLSDAGVKALRKVIHQNEKYANNNSRQPKAIRGIGYRSKFMRDFTYCPEILRHLSHCSGKPMHPHNMGMNLAQINFGEIGVNKKVDKWHIDSVPYVMVLLLSDATGMQGGQLQVARFGDPKKALDMIYRNGELPSHLVDTVNYPRAGYAIFMQGSSIAHGVTPVSKAREQRVTLVNSYQSLNPFEEDRTIYSTFKVIDGSTAPFEFARHQAWRAQGKLDYLLNKAKYFGTTKAIEEVLDMTIADLKRARDLITGETVEALPWAQDKEDGEDETRPGAGIHALKSKL
jgi:hypothetical protein